MSYPARAAGKYDKESFFYRGNTSDFFRFNEFVVIYNYIDDQSIVHLILYDFIRLILTACQPILGYFMLKNWFCLYLNFSMELNGNYTRMFRVILNKSWKQHPTKRQLYGHLSPISKAIQVRRTRYSGHNWRSKDELKDDVLLWTPSHERPNVVRPERHYFHQFFADTGYSFEDLPRAMNDRDGEGERVKKIRAVRMT